MAIPLEKHRKFPVFCRRNRRIGLSLIYSLVQLAKTRGAQLVFRKTKVEVIG